MQTDTWDRIQGIFLEAVDLNASERATFLDRACVAEPGIRAEVESLLRADAPGKSSVESAIGSEAVSLLEERSLIGSRLGSYRVVQEIGRGGMGSVYLGERDDDQFHKQVAIKVVKRGMDTDEVLGRFRHERQILAGLEHPYIARLLDGGTTGDGRPFFVMEKVEGRPVDVYCREQNLNLKSRLQLFARICEAVAHAHRALVVHRDLKPSNILVTVEGVPKLLDFGVAKLLGTSDPGLTSTVYGVGPLTPEYASPEQVRGLPVTTATDVYALGAILYELLTDSRAQKIAAPTLAEIDRVVCETQAPRPSAVSPTLRLDGDLDNIVLMAMRKEPERRYPSVDQFAQDLARYLDGLPVAARQDSFSYRWRKFSYRNRLALAAAALVFGSLVAGVTVSVSQAREAEAARRVAEAQKRAAERERVRAEAEAQVAKIEQDRSALRLTQMVELANRSLYDVHSAIAKLAGATEARRQIVSTTLQFLENLSKDTGHDDRLRFVLSTAYLKVADVQGSPLRPNLGDSKGALENYQKSIDLIEPLLAKEPDRPDYLLQWLEARRDSATVLARSGELPRAVSIWQSLLPAGQRLASLCPRDTKCAMAEASIYAELVVHLRTSRSAVALSYSRRQIQSLERAAQRFPGNPEIQFELATAYSEQATALHQRGDLRDAVERFQRAIALRESVLQQNPGDVLIRRDLMITYGNLGGTLGGSQFLNLGDAAGAREYYGKALAVARELAQADSSDQLAQYDLAYAMLFYASCDLPREEWAGSLSLLRESEGILQKLLAADPGSVSKLRPLALAQEYEGRRSEGLGNPTAALAAYRLALANSEKALARNSLDLTAIRGVVTNEEAIAELLARQGDRAGALESARKAVARAEQASAPDSERDRIGRLAAIAFHTLARVQADFGMWSEARAAVERAAANWQKLRASGSPYLDAALAARSDALLRECEEHLEKNLSTLQNIQ